MAKELDEMLSILERISPRDKEVILLAPIFFWAKYKRRRINSEGFEPVVPEVDFSDPISIFKTGLDLHRLENSDIEDDVVGAVTNLLSKHPKRGELFPHLSDEEIKDICGKLNDIFEEQEFCAMCEAWSQYDVGPEDFAVGAADKTLYLKGRSIGLSWFAKIFAWRDRQPIIKAILQEKLFGGINRLPLFV